jgi:hypothetical protein
VAIACSSVLPSVRTSPSASAWCSKPTPAPSGRYAVAPVRAMSSGSPGDVVGLDVGLDDGGDLGALCFGQRDVFVDEVDVRVDDREPPDGLAAEQVRSAGGVVVEELAEVHGAPRSKKSLTSYQVIY